MMPHCETLLRFPAFTEPGYCHMGESYTRGVFEQRGRDLCSKTKASVRNKAYFFIHIRSLAT